MSDAVPAEIEETAETKQYDLLMAGNIEKLLKQTDHFDDTQQNGLLGCDSVSVYIHVCVPLRCHQKMLNRATHMTQK